MLTITLDEQGNFEKVYNHKRDASSPTGKPVFIGGLIFDDKGNIDAVAHEKERISKYLKEMCRKASAVYPTDLHVNTSTQNDERVGKVKEKIRSTLAKFLTSKECKGVYYIFANMLCDDGSQKIYTGKSELIREDYGGNLYLHMVEDVIERVIFHNPVFDKIDHIKLVLPTRRAVFMEDQEGKEEEYIRLNHREVKIEEEQKQGKISFNLTNADVFRTVIGREMMDTEQTNIRIEGIDVKPISYKAANKDK